MLTNALIGQGLHTRLELPLYYRDLGVHRVGVGKWILVPKRRVVGVKEDVHFNVCCPLYAPPNLAVVERDRVVMSRWQRRLS